MGPGCTGIECEGHPAFDGTNNGSGACGPWESAGWVVPANSFAGGYKVVSANIANGGINYVVGNTLTVVGGTAKNSPAQIQVVAVDGTGKITVAGVQFGGGYTANPASPNSPTGGAGSGASFNLTFGTGTIDLSVCKKRAFKNGQAHRFWHGHPGYWYKRESVAINCPGPSGPPGSKCGWTMTLPFQPTPSRTKYLHLEATATETLFTGTGYRCGGATTSYSRNIVSDVNSTSGVKNTSGSQTSPIDIGFSTALDSLMGMA